MTPIESKMTTLFKDPRFYFSVIVGSALIFIYIQYREESKKLSHCSVYTIGNIDRVFTIRGQTRIDYYYNVGEKTAKTTEGVNNFDTNESWSVDVEKLSKRRLLLQVSCHDINVNRILWDIPVPDTLRYVPANGWKEIPFQRQK